MGVVGIKCDLGAHDAKDAVVQVCGDDVCGGDAYAYDPIDHANDGDDACGDGDVCTVPANMGKTGKGIVFYRHDPYQLADMDKQMHFRPRIQTYQPLTLNQ